MYAVIEDSGCQIKVSEGDVIKIDVRDLPENAAELTFDKVMLVGGGSDAAQIGAPYVSGATVSADILEEGRGEKIHIWKFRRRKTYKRHNGHRQNYLKVKVTGINA